MKLTALILFAIPSLATADLKDYTKDQLKSYIIKQNGCVFAAAQTNITIEQMGDKVKGDQKKWPLSPFVLCVGDSTLNKGGIDERKACALGYLNVESGEFLRFVNSMPPINTSKKCDAGGFEDLLKVKVPVSNPYTIFAKYPKTEAMIPVSAWLTDQGHSAFGKFGRVLLFSEKTKWSDWWEKERGEVQAIWKKSESEEKQKKQIVAEKKGKVESTAKSQDANCRTLPAFKEMCDQCNLAQLGGGNYCKTGTDDAPADERQKFHASIQKTFKGCLGFVIPSNEDALNRASGYIGDICANKDKAQSILEIKKYIEPSNDN